MSITYVISTCIDEFYHVHDVYVQKCITQTYLYGLDIVYMVIYEMIPISNKKQVLLQMKTYYIYGNLIYVHILH